MAVEGQQERGWNASLRRVLMCVRVKCAPHVIVAESFEDCRGVKRDGGKAEEDIWPFGRLVVTPLGSECTLEMQGKMSALSG